jgi:hypothetical protein
LGVDSTEGVVVRIIHGETERDQEMIDAITKGRKAPPPEPKDPKKK